MSSRYSKRDYERFARHIKDLKEQDTGGFFVLNSLTSRLADDFEKDNKLFDRVRFLRACGF